MLIGPDWNKLYAEGKCLYYGEPRSDEQWKALDEAKDNLEKEALIRKFREEYLKNKDIVTGEIKKEAEKSLKTPIEEPAEEAVTEDPAEESIEDVKPVKKTNKKGK